MIAAEADAIHTARSGRSLAEIMLARGAQLPRVAPRNVEQAVTKAEQAAKVVAEAEQITAEAAEDIAVIEIGDVPTSAPCGHPSCAHADPTTPCVCSFCIGAGHGWITAQRQEATRGATQASIDDRGGIREVMRKVGALAPVDEFDFTAGSWPGLAAIRFDGDGWPID